MDEKKLVIDIFRTKTADDFTKAIADPDGRLETGSAAADGGGNRGGARLPRGEAHGKDRRE